MKTREHVELEPTRPRAEPESVIRRRPERSSPLKRRSLLRVAPALLALAACLQAAHARQPTPAADCVAPGVSFGRLFNEVRIGYTDGRFSIGTLYAT